MSATLLLRGVSFDAVGTLLEPAAPVAQTYAAAARAHGLVVSVDQVEARFRLAFRRHLPLRARDGDWKAYWEAVIAETLGDGSSALLRRLYDHYARAQAWRVVDGARGVLKELRTAGFKLAMISNFDRRLRPILAGLGLEEAFDTVVVSGEEGVEKPDPQIFVRAARRLGLAPGELLHVGDDKAADVAGARRAGLQALQIRVDLADLAQLPGWVRTTSSPSA